MIRKIKDLQPTSTSVIKHCKVVGSVTTYRPSVLAITPVLFKQRSAFIPCHDALIRSGLNDVVKSRGRQGAL